jgi:exopolyphosphatase / guanosine-5'-triphosphate,3'-diphosphate pyrophosphatase
MTERRYVLQLLALRLAVIKCHARGAVDTAALRLSFDGRDRARVRFDTTWADGHPRTLYLLEQEVEAWSRSGAITLDLASSAT